MSLLSPRKKLFDSRGARRRRKRRRNVVILVVLVALLGGGAYALNQAPMNPSAAIQDDGRNAPGPAPEDRPPAREGRDGKPEEKPPVGSAEEKPEPVPPEAKETPAGAAYWKVASELPETDPGSLTAVFRSKIDPAWASVHFKPPDEKKFFAVFVRKDGGVWKAGKSIRADEPDYPKNDLVPLAEVPKDLVQYLYPKNLFAVDVPEPEQVKLDKGALPETEPATFPSPEPEIEGASKSERERAAAGIKETREKIEGYGGIAGVYVHDLEGDWSYGIRQDETFFSASIIKVPIMVAVYRDIDRGKLSLNESFQTEKGDWASGAGWLQWEKAGKSYTVESYLYMMMTQSDNVAANALVRKVGGADRVNEVARSMGAKDTLLYQKVSSERAAVPALDNRTTPRDMATMMEKIATEKAASPISCKDMVDMMYQNQLGWMSDNLPTDVYASSKAGWLYEVYNEAGIVEKGDHPYVAAILTKYGPDAPATGGGALLKGLTETTWKGQQNPEKENKDSKDGGSGKDSSGKNDSGDGDS